jgi:glycerol-3-phosphate acyltransferase PlsY
VFAPFYQLLFWGAGPAAGAIALMGLLLVWRHTANIQKLLRGTESRIGQKKADSVAAQASTAHAPHKPAPAHKNAPNATPKHAPGQSLKHGHKGGTKQ